MSGALEKATFFFTRRSFLLNGQVSVLCVRVRLPASAALPHWIRFRIEAAPEFVVLLTVCAFRKHLGGFNSRVKLVFCAVEAVLQNVVLLVFCSSC